MLPLLVATYATAADEAADRAAINQTITAVNQSRDMSLFSGDGWTEWRTLPGANTTRILPVGMSPVPVDHPTVIISKEPWGEASIIWPGMAQPAALEIAGSRIMNTTIRFVSPDVAMVDGTWSYTNGTASQYAPLLVVMKREGETWKIASVRLLAAR